MLTKSENNGTEETVLVTPTPVQGTVWHGLKQDYRNIKWVFLNLVKGLYPIALHESPTLSSYAYINNDLFTET